MYKQHSAKFVQPTLLVLALIADTLLLRFFDKDT